ncbi:hypothetical protein BHM03_00058448 [Ensete ventricosum]|nr:hypothetical protein BHM03_00058448 [Ensete ventricosum]
MRLYRVESFYAFLLRFRNKGSEKEGRPATANPICKVGHPRPDRGQGQPEREASGARRGSSPQGQHLQAEAPPAGTTGCGSRLQGACKGLPPTASSVANRGSGASCRGGCPLAGRLLAGKGSRHLRRGNGGAEGERGVRASFREKDDPAPINSKNFED